MGLKKEISHKIWLTVRKGSLGFEIKVTHPINNNILIKVYCILARKCHFSYLTLRNGFKANFLLSVYLLVPGNVMFMTFQFCLLKEQGSL